MDLISIILPTYQRAHFIAKAFASIAEQTYQHWELIIVDDGSMDDTESIVKALSAQSKNAIHFIKQPNQGPAVARNTGIKAAQGKYLAFFDSDDLWLPHHLNDCVQALEANKKVAWVYGACKRMNLETNEVLCESTFHVDDNDSLFFQLNTRQEGTLNIIEDSRTAFFQICYGLDSGLQNSLIRSEVFSKHLIPTFRIGEDRLFILLAIKSGFTFAYLDNVHVLYNVHDGNTSDTASNDERYDKRINAMLKLLECLEATEHYVCLTKAEKKALNRQIANDYFWKLGYSLQWQDKQFKNALASFIYAIKLWPTNIKYWKTLLTSLVKILIK